MIRGKYRITNRYHTWFILKRLSFASRYRHEKRQLLSFLSNQLSGNRTRLKTMKDHDIPIPDFCVVSVTDQCNLHCAGCYAKRERDKTTSDIDRLGKILFSLIESGITFFAITGGEPLLVRNMIPLMGELRKASFLMVTNGLLLNESHINELRLFPNIIPVISLEGNAGTTDERRGLGVYGKSDHAMALLKRRGIGFGVSVTVTKKNLSRIIEKDFYTSLYNRGASLVFLIDYVSVDGSYNEWRLSDSEVKCKDSELRNIRKRSPLLIHSIPGDESPENKCLAGGTGMLYIDTRGDVSPCPLYPVNAGNLLEKDLIEILKADQMVSARELTMHEINGKPVHLCTTRQSISSSFCANHPLSQLRSFTARELPANIPV